MSVTIIADPKTGSKIRYYASNPEFAYCVMQTTKIVHRAGGFIDNQTRTTILRAKKNIMQTFVDSCPNGVASGNIVVREFTESECPQEFMSRLRSDVDYEKAIQSFLKRPQDDAPCLRKQGERILRFTDYDPDNVMQDVRVEHDNQEEIAQWRVASKAGTANLPG
jgi:hypothetical protein